MDIAGIDIGGTNIEIGVVDDEHCVSHRAKVPTPSGGPASVVDAIVELLDAVEVVAVGVGVPGAVHDDEVVYAPNLEGWTDDVDLVVRLTDRIGLPIALGNDANVGLLGEWLAGAAKDHHDVLGVWMGTGIGGGLILDGRPCTGSLGAAGEIGHMIIRAGGALCSCGRRGCVEAYAGRRTMTAAATALVDAGRTTTLFEIQADEGKAQPTSKVWARALDEGDDVVRELFGSAVESVAIGVASVVNLLDVEQVVIGGGMAEKLGQDLADRIHDEAVPWMLHPNPDLVFAVAALGDDSGVVGAAALGRAAVLQG